MSYGGVIDSSSSDEDAPSLLAAYYGGIDTASSEDEAQLPNYGAIHSDASSDDDAAAPSSSSLSEPANEKNRKRLSLRISAFDSDDERCKWNTEFQKALDRVKELPYRPDLPYSEREKIWRDLASLARDFTYSAKTYGRIIISEVFLPPEERTIKPVSSMGGIAGGEKFIVNSILFKFAIDHEGIYGGDEHATYMNAGQDLLGLNSYSTLSIHDTDLTTDHPDFCFPICVLIDYRGFRLIAIAILPISGSSTLVCGSSDGGYHVVAKDEEAVNMMRMCANDLNLSTHYVVSKKDNKLVELPMAADMEVHRGRDSRLYVLDYSRAFPPQDINLMTDVPMRHLLFKLRPEWVQMQPKKMNPDVFSQFIRFGKGANVSSEDKEKLTRQRKEDEAYAREVTRRLLEEHIPNVSKKLVEMVKELNTSELHEFFTSWISVVVHFHGINLRWLGRLRNCIPDETEHQKIWRGHLLIEMISRVLRFELSAILRFEMRRIRKTGEQPYFIKTVEYMNLVFGDSQQSRDYWNGELKNWLRKRFPNSLDGMPEDVDLKEVVMNFIPPTPSLFHETPTGLCTLFHKFAVLAAVKFTGNVFEQFSTTPSLFAVEYPFDVIDISALEERIKRTHIISHSAGAVYRMQGTAQKNRPRYSKTLFKLSLNLFRESLTAVPRDQRTLRNTADVFQHLGYLRLAKQFYLLGLEANPNDSISIYKYGYFLHKSLKDYAEAEKYYDMSINVNKTPGNMIAFAKYWLEFKRIDRARELLSQAVEIFSKSAVVHLNFALLLHNYPESDDDLRKAAMHYETAVKLDPNDTAAYKAYVEFVKETDSLGASTDVEKLTGEIDMLTRRSHTHSKTSFRFADFEKNPLRTSQRDSQKSLLYALAEVRTESQGQSGATGNDSTPTSPLLPRTHAAPDEIAQSPTRLGTSGGLGDALLSSKLNSEALSLTTADSSATTPPPSSEGLTTSTGSLRTTRLGGGPHTKQ